FVATGDFNNDGWDDVLVRTDPDPRGDPHFPAHWTFYRSNGGGLEPGTSIALPLGQKGTDFLDPIVADLNGDGAPEIGVYVDAEQGFVFHRFVVDHFERLSGAL